jgi:hypothetical protein
MLRLGLKAGLKLNHRAFVLKVANLHAPQLFNVWITRMRQDTCNAPLSYSRY